MMSITRDELLDIIRQEIEAVSDEMQANVIDCVADGKAEMLNCMGVERQLDKKADRLRPEKGDVGQPTMNGVLGEKTRGPYKTRAEKVKSKAKRKRRDDREKMRKKILGGEAMMNSLGLSEEEIEEDKKKKKKGRGQQTKPGKNKKQCSPGSPHHSKETGRFVDPHEEAGSWSILAKGSDCSRGQFKRPHANTSTQFTKRPCGRKAREDGINRKCSTGKIHENWRRFLHEVEEEEKRKQKVDFGNNVKMTVDQLRAELKKELMSVLSGYSKQLSDKQKKAILNSPDRLSDDKLAVFCDSFGTTSFHKYLTTSNAINVMANNIVSKYGKQTVQQPEQDKDFQQTSDNTQTHRAPEGLPTPGPLG